MPHEMIDEIQSRRGEKVAVFLTMENATGLVLGAIPGFLMTFRAMPWYLSFLITLTAGGLGFLATIEIGGMACYERAIWWVRGYLSQRIDTPRITPEEITGGRTIGQRDAAIPLSGPVRLVRQQRTILHRPTAIPFRRRAAVVKPGLVRGIPHSDEPSREGHNANPTTGQFSH